MNGWAPYSPCTTACVAHAAPPVPSAVALRRRTSFAGVALRTVLRPGRLARPDAVRAMAADLLAAAGVQLEVTGERGALSVPGASGTLVVANHVSWLDVLAVLAVEPVTMLAKREVGAWPVVGGLAVRAGTRFIDRDSLKALPGTVAELARLLREGRSVMAFPEGTTRCSVPGRMHRAVFQAALDAAAPIRPLTLSYLQHGHPSTVPAYVGADPFSTSFSRVLRASGLTVRVHVHPPVHPSPADTRRALAAHTRETLQPVVAPARLEHAL